MALKEEARLSLRWLKSCVQNARKFSGPGTLTATIFHRAPVTAGESAYFGWDFNPDGATLEEVEEFIASCTESDDELLRLVEGGIVVSKSGESVFIPDYAHVAALKAEEAAANADDEDEDDDGDEDDDDEEDEDEDEEEEEELKIFEVEVRGDYYVMRTGWVTVEARDADHAIEIVEDMPYRDIRDEVQNWYDDDDPYTGDIEYATTGEVEEVDYLC